MVDPAAFHHVPVLLQATVDLLQVRPGGTYADGTLGGGGHAEAVLEASGPNGVLVGVDRDPFALEAASKRLARFGDRFIPKRGCFADLPEITQQQAPFDGILLDIGVSSPQLDTPARGFSIQHDGPVDMRMDTDQEISAAELLDQIDATELVDILRRYGEEPRARQIARAILAGRPWHSTSALADCVAKASGYRNSRVHPATRTFQALRIAVNKEIEQLERALEQVPSLIQPGGRLAVITFHSLEDRLVKHRFRDLAGKNTPKDHFGNPVTPPFARLVTRKGISGKQADPNNPRARSARLRVIEINPVPTQESTDSDRDLLQSKQQ